MSEFISFAGYVIAAAMAVVAFFCWRKTLGLHAVLDESIQRFDVMRKRGQELEVELRKTSEKLEQKTDQLKRLEKSAKSAKNRKNDDQQKLQVQVADYKEKLETQDLQLDHLKKQVDALTAQLKEADYERKDLQTRLSYSSKGLEEKIAEKTEPLIEEIKTLKKQKSASENRAENLQQKLSELKKLTAEIDPAAVKNLKRRAQHFESLYKSMRGLREMSDERNRNWEVALKRMASWILDQSDIEHRDKVKNAPLGPLVGEALEVIGERLVKDEFSKQGAMAKRDQSQQSNVS